ncbi:GreA/GreB family elongation factor [Bacteriovorax sp. DB6_IX]|uniref:GreA/GreB family elongation factor n=1 Tax=Bacteriovorax sp. DB6_IX TaxID=1353530 RepID=UPI00054D101E|nr:GreA/GreB family elongation factor [Bacteriovorax sp. DB6_IX]
MDKTQIIEKIVAGLETEANMSADEHSREELLSEKELYEEISLDDKSGTVQIGSVVNIRYNGKLNTYFLAPSGMGNIMKVGDKVVVVISVFSTLGSAILNTAVGDEVIINMRGEDRIYLIDEII